MRAQSNAERLRLRKGQRQRQRLRLRGRSLGSWVGAMSLRIEHMSSHFPEWLPWKWAEAGLGQCKDWKTWRVSVCVFVAQSIFQMNDDCLFVGVLQLSNISGHMGTGF